MRIIRVYLKKRSYDIIVGNNIISLLGKYLIKLNLGSDAYVITNPLIKKKYGSTLNKVLKKSGFTVRFKLVPDSEESKSIETSSAVIKDIAHYDKSKRIFIIAFGGGVIGDLAGFVASVYRRGIPYIQVPSTLLAQVDSSIGGKTAVDLAEGKNLIGVFYQPRLVFSESGFLKTLALRQIRSGLAEAIKYGLIKDRQLFAYIQKKYKDILALRPYALEHIISRSSYIKANIVSRDEREEKGLRTILNFGHTIGHAIETASRYQAYNHGEAIAVGMLIASDISKSLNLINDKVLKTVEVAIKAVGLPTKIEKVPLANIINAHYHDKKFIGAKRRFVLIKGIGEAKIVENIPLEIIRKAIKKRIKN
jgi:3-dehydroquinate synthase